jgi:predicted amidohydrolase
MPPLLRLNVRFVAVLLLGNAFAPIVPSVSAAVKTYRVGLISMRGERWQLEENYRRLEAYTREAARRGAQVVVAPEGLLDGYVCGAAADATRERMVEVAQRIPDGPYLVRAGQLCRELGIYLIFGFLEQHGNDLRNSCLMIDPQGSVVGQYSKVYPNGELFITAGRELRAFDTPLGRVGFLICADRAISANFPPYGAQQTQLVFLPMDGGGGPDNTQAMRRHAQQHAYWIFIANSWSRVVIDPTGEVLLEDYTTEGVSVAEVTVATQTSADRAAPAALGELVKKAFDVTKGRWDLQGRPLPGEVEAQDQFLHHLGDFRQRTDAHMAAPDFGIGDGLVNLSNSSVTDTGLAHLAPFADRLQGLWLRNTQVTDDGLSRLAELSNLRLLVLFGTPVTDAGMQHLTGLSKLRVLNLTGTQVTDAGLAPLKHCRDLQWLYLERTQITDAGLAQLKQCGKLRWLFLAETAVTDDAIVGLEQSIPGLVINR